VKAHIRHASGHTFLAKAESNHWLPMDSALAPGEPFAANNPVQILVMACGGCVSIDIIDILKKSRKDVTRYEMEVEATRAESNPKILKSLCFHALVDGPGITFELMQRALELSLTKYCSVSLSLDRSVKFKARITLNGDRSETWEIPRNPAIFER
jgi:putative redox protein